MGRVQDLKIKFNRPTCHTSCGFVSLFLETFAKITL